MKKNEAQFLVRAPLDLRELILNEAKNQNISGNDLCLYLLRRGLTGHVPGTTVSGIKTDLGSSLVKKLIEFIDTQLTACFGESLVGVVLFGSAARGSMRASSDIDLLIVLSMDVELDRDIYDRFPKTSIDNHEVSPLIVTMPLSGQELRTVWLEAALDGVILFDPELTVARLLSGIRRKIAEGRIQRRFSYGVPYWVKNESEMRSIDS